MFVGWLWQLQQWFTMISLKRGLVYSLLLSIGLLVAGMVTLLWVTNAREQRYQDELGDMRRSLSECNDKLNQQKAIKTTAAADSSWGSWPADITPTSATGPLPSP